VQPAEESKGERGKMERERMREKGVKKFGKSP